IDISPQMNPVALLGASIETNRRTGTLICVNSWGGNRRPLPARAPACCIQIDRRRYTPGPGDSAAAMATYSSTDLTCNRGWRRRSSPMVLTVRPWWSREPYPLFRELGHELGDFADARV